MARKVGIEMVSQEDIIHEVVDEAIKKKNIKRYKLIDIEPNPLNEFSMKDIELFADNILENGLLNPVIVYRTDHGNLRLLGGHRRLAASTLNLTRGGDEYIDCIEVEKPKNGLVELKIIAVLNNQREFSNDDKLKLISTYAEVYRSLTKDERKVNGQSLKMREWIGLQTGINLTGRQVQNYLAQLDSDKKVEIISTKSKTTYIKNLINYVNKSSMKMAEFEIEEANEEEVQQLELAINELKCVMINLTDLVADLKKR